MKKKIKRLILDALKTDVSLAPMVKKVAAYEGRNPNGAATAALCELFDEVPHYRDFVMAIWGEIDLQIQDGAR